MKKLLIGILIVSSLLIMTACGKSGDKSNTTFESSEPVYESITWPTSDIAKLLPVPKSTIGKIEWEASYGFVIDVAETTKADYDEYVSLCQEAGFTENYNKGDDYFMGDNSDGYQLYLRFDEGDVMFIRMDEPKETDSNESESENSEEPVNNQPEETSDSNAPESDNVEEPANNDTTSVTPEFKEMMDSYEAFFDEYVEFMKKYKESGNQAEMMADLADYMSKYSDMMSKLNAVNESELSIADSAYYLEVSGRITKKLAEVA